MRGRTPVPSHLKLVTGNPGHRPVEESVVAEVLAPDRPEFLSQRASAEWDRIVPELEKLNLLARVDGAALAMYCQAYGRWRQAEEKITEAEKADAEGAGMVISSPNGFKMLSQWAVISKQAQEQLLRYLVEFGMTPAARARVKAIKGGQGTLFPENDPMEGVLRAGAAAVGAGARTQ